MVKSDVTDLLSKEIDHCTSNLILAKQRKLQAESDTVYWDRQLESARAMHARYAFGLDKTWFDANK